jgi:hypothetical protein
MVTSAEREALPSRAADEPFRAAHMAFVEGLRGIEGNFLRAGSEADLQAQRRRIEVTLAPSADRAAEVLLEARREYDSALQSAVHQQRAELARLVRAYLENIRQAWASVDLEAVDGQLLYNLAQSHLCILGSRTLVRKQIE